MSATRSLYQVFQQEFHRYYEPLCQYAFTLLKEQHPCEDIVQDIFLHVWEKKQNLVGEESLRFYLYTAVRNNCITYLQKSRKSVVTGLTGHESASSPTVLYNAEKAEIDFANLLKEALDRLPPKCREVFVLSRMSRLTYQQIADTLGISVKTVENQMGKALKILRTFIKEKQVYVSGWLIFIFNCLLT